ncbi:MAG: hypothetical protein AB7D06_15465 [Pedobacter sp.]
MKKLTVNLLMVAAVFMLSNAAFAAGQTNIPTFEYLDADQNGFITSEEAASCETLITDFATVDANQDGKLDQAEYAAFTDKAVQKS